jgi:Undecaprenyl-phosphate glucose phosphotransferase
MSRLSLVFLRFAPSTPGMPWRGVALPSLLALGDGSTVLVLGLLCRGLNPRSHAGHTLREVLVILATAALVVGCMAHRHLYHRPAGRGGKGPHLPPALAPSINAFALMLLALLVWDGVASLGLGQASGTVLANRNWLCAWALLTPPILLGLHHGLHPWLRARVSPPPRRSAIIVGGGDHVRHLAAYLADNPASAFRVAGYLRMADSAVGVAPPDWPVLRDLRAVRAAIQSGGVDLVVIALPGAASRRIRDIMGRMSALPIDIRLAPDLGSFHFREARVSSISGLPFLNLRDRPISGGSATVKRIEDLALASLLLLMLGPLMLLLALVVRLDSAGPALFVQTRLGFNHRVIRVRKFRSMRVDEADAAGRWQAVRQDPRVTRFGRWLRRTSLDELPQLLNVLAGDMSLVGPRPHALDTRAAGEPFDQAVADYAARHRVKPGITGWAQIHGWRGETDTVEKLRQRVAHDMHYIDNWSIGLDLTILLRTASILRGPQAF